MDHRTVTVCQWWFRHPIIENKDYGRCCALFGEIVIMNTRLQFAAHGEHRIEKLDNMLICRIRGAWNGEQAGLYLQDLANQIQHFFTPFSQRWARIMDMRQWELSTPQARDKVIDFLHWETTQHCQLRVFCHCSAVQKRLIRDKYADSTPLVLLDDLQQGVFFCQNLLRTTSRKNAAGY